MFSKFGGRKNFNYYLSLLISVPVLLLAAYNEWIPSGDCVYIILGIVGFGGLGTGALIAWEDRVKETNE